MGQVPDGVPSCRVRRLAADPRGSGLHARAASRQAQVQPATIMEGARQGQGAAHEIGHPLQGLRGGQVQNPGDLHRRARHDPQGNVQQDAEGSVGAGHEAEGVEPRHILEDRAAEPQDLAAAVQDPDAQDKVAHPAGERSPGPREPCRHRSAQGSARAQPRRLEGQHLAVPRQEGLDLRQRRARPCGQDQLGGIVVDHPPVSRHLKRGPRDGESHPGVGPAPADLQRTPVRRRTPHRLGQGRRQVGVRTVRGGQREGLRCARACRRTRRSGRGWGWPCRD